MLREKDYAYNNTTRVMQNAGRQQAGSMTKPIAYYPIYKLLTNSTSAAVFLSQALYWQKRCKGEFYKTQAAWQNETGLSRREQETARRILRELGVLKEQAKGLPRRLYYQVDTVRLNELIASLQALQSRNPQSTKPRKRRNPVCRNAPYLSGAFVQSSMAQSDIQVCHDVADKCARAEQASNVQSSVSQRAILEEPQSLSKQELSDKIEGSVLQACMMNDSGTSQSATPVQTGQTGQDSGGQSGASVHSGLKPQVIVKPSLSVDEGESVSVSLGDMQACDSATSKSAQNVHTSLHETCIQVCTNAPHFTTTYVNSKIYKESKTENKEENKEENKTEITSENKTPLSSKKAKDVTLTILSSPQKIFAASASESNSPEQVCLNETGADLPQPSPSPVCGNSTDDNKARPEPAETAKKPRRRTKSAENESNYVSEGKNATAGKETASETKCKAPDKAKNDDDAFRGEFFAFAKKAIDWIVRRGGVKEDPAAYWAWARKLRQRDERITVHVLQQCFNHYAAEKNGTWWRSPTKTFKQFVAAFNDIYQSYQQTYQQTYQQKGAQNETGVSSASGASIATHSRIARAQEYWNDWLAISKRSGLFTQTEQTEQDEQRASAGNADAGRQSVSPYRPLQSGSTGRDTADIQPDA